eukprot:2454148-Amphidinium_carterae.1
MYSEGGYRDGLEVALRSACLTDSQLNVSLHVLALPKDEPRAAELQLDWDTSGMPCRLYTFTYENDRYSWEGRILEKVRQHYANVYNFAQHIDLPAILGRRGVEMAMVIDTDVLFLGEDPVRGAVERCVVELRALPKAVLCSAKSKTGWGMGALILNTKRYAALDMDYQIYKFAESQQRIGGTKPLMNAFFAAYKENVIAAVPEVQKKPNDRPCNEGIAHWATGAKPWTTTQTSRYCPKEGGDCSKFALCRWWQYKNSEVDIPQPLVAAEPQPLASLALRKQARKPADPTMALHIALAHVDGDLRMAMEAAAKAACLTAVQDAAK